MGYIRPDDRSRAEQNIAKMLQAGRLKSRALNKVGKELVKDRTQRGRGSTPH